MILVASWVREFLNANKGLEIRVQGSRDVDQALDMELVQYDDVGLIIHARRVLCAVSGVNTYEEGAEKLIRTTLARRYGAAAGSPASSATDKRYAFERFAPYILPDPTWPRGVLEHWVELQGEWERRQAEESPNMQRGEDMAAYRQRHSKLDESRADQARNDALKRGQLTEE